MATNFLKINQGINFNGQSSAPSNPTNGDIYYNSTFNKFQKYENGQWIDIGTNSHQLVQITATAGGTTNLVITDKQIQYWTGSANQTIVLPNATLYNSVGSEFEFYNASTGILTINTFGGAFLKSVIPNTSYIVKLVDQSTSTGTWVEAYPQNNIFSTISDSTSGSAVTLASFTAGIIRLTAVGTLVSIAGIPAGLDGQVLLLENDTGSPINILNNDSGATAANRIYTGTSGTLSLANQASLVFSYNSTNAKWQLVAGSGGASPGIGDIVSINSGVSSGTVTFGTPQSGTNYVVVAQLENLVDSSPQFQNIVITNKTTSGFSWKINAATDSANYKIAYKILSNSTGSGVQVGEASINNGVTSIVITIPIAFATTTYVAVVNMVNYIDSNPEFQPCLITNKTTTSFTVSWNAATDSANYKIAYNLN